MDENLSIAFRLPEWEDVYRASQKRDLTPLEQFVLDNEPAAGPWRAQLQEMIDWIILIVTHPREDNP